MNKYETLAEAIEEVETLLAFLFTTGLYSASGEMAERLNAAVENLSQYGIGHGAVLLKKVADQLDAKRFSMEYDYTELADDFCRIHVYLKVLKNAMDLRQVGDEAQERRMWKSESE